MDKENGYEIYAMLRHLFYHYLSEDNDCILWRRYIMPFNESRKPNKLEDYETTEVDFL
eukprot:CAMPEP_0197675902 /NCGR_PEP_ID=MMETSP1338-20131121/85807_1 /TAXON_ID=43686 ORGANISM="Pelagodinium beii, Strain RCC1491" /NCGR_SAMPLE_ID=MMETSP1338 /ASSEMBLY_ACC=CAM_ASM_000754 /LENGTH=57 /DNA_ID=CAMNT_0043256509 /DNA_START=147 /DNA_END=320 /DNA_ORIENTATION=+